MLLKYNIIPGTVLLRSILLLSVLLACIGTYAQQLPIAKDTISKKGEIVILDNEEGIFLQNDTNAVHKLLGNVKLLHGTDTLYCDSAYFFTKKNSVEAFGNVWVRQLDGTEASADYMRYNGRTKTVVMIAKYAHSEVQLYDGKTNTLWSREVEYNLNTKVGKYHKRGYLQTETTVLESDKGVYNLKTKDARFTGNVSVADPKYAVVSNDLGYNTNTEIVTFFSPSIVTNDQSVLQTSSGYYNAKSKTAYFDRRSAVLNEAKYIEADTLDYNKVTGWAVAIGNVIAIDTGMKSTVYCGKAEYNELKKTMLAYSEPIMKRTDGKDNYYYRSDTFYIAPEPKRIAPATGQDSLQQTADDILNAVGNAVDTTVIAPDSITKDSIPDTVSRQDIEDSGFSLLHIPDSLSNTNKTSNDDSIELNDIQQTADVPIVDTLAAQKEKVAAIKFKMDAIINQQDSINKQSLATGNDSTISDHKQQLDALSATYDNKPAGADTAGPKFFIGYRNVVIYSDSMQGKCDSIYYAESDSLLRMFQSPVLWPNNGQLSGDIIIMKLDSNKMKEVIVPKNGIAIYRSGPEAAQMYDQIQGNLLHGYLTNNAIDSLIAETDAYSIYFIKDEDSAYVGCSEAKAARIEVYFANEEIERIIYRSEVEQSTTPMKDVNATALRLSRFAWLEDKRTKSLNEFLQGRVLPKPELLFEEAAEASEEEP